MKQQSLQDQLHALLNCDLKTLFPVAREQKRKLFFYVGPTNSGKTYHAMQELMDADCGVYLAPLRLLALESYETIKEAEIPVSLITGEEEHIDEEAGHICSTIEMVNFSFDVDVCVIDEVQMLEDPDRGWAWVNAIVGAPAKKVIMTGSVNALDAIKQIAAYLGEELEIVKFQRKNPLHMMHKAVPLDNVEAGTALVAFSRAEVLRLKSRLSKRHKVSVIYGNLSPEVRREEARRFREGESTVLVATDAIAMGLNLPIKTLLFTTDRKFDGVDERPLTPNEVIQIAGRAGRYGHFDSGYIGATNRKALRHVDAMFHAPLHTIKPPFSVKATPRQIEALAAHLKTDSLHKILEYFSRHMRFTGPFVAANISSMIDLAQMIDGKKGLDLATKYMLAQAPVSTKSPLIKRAYFFYVNAVVDGTIVAYRPSIKLHKKVRSEKELLEAEDEVKKISLYLWIAYKLPELFPDSEGAEQSRGVVNHYCQNALKERKLKKMEQRKKGDNRPYPRRTPKQNSGNVHNRHKRRR